MEQLLGYVIFGTGWPILIIGSIWMVSRASALSATARTLLLVALAALYTLAYTCTVFWLGGSWLLGVLPAFAMFLVLFVLLFRELRALPPRGT